MTQVTINPPGETAITVNDPAPLVVRTNIPVAPNPRAWCTFADNTTQHNPSPNAVNVFSYDTPDGSDGITVVNNTDLVVEKAGVYNLSFSIMLTKTGGGTANVDIWAAKNGTNIPDSNTRFTLSGNGDHQVAAWILTYALEAGDALQLRWSSASTSVNVPAYQNLTLPPRPNIPSVIGQIWQIADTPPN